MAKELGGYGNTAGQSVGGSGANLNERPDNSTPGGGSKGHAGDRNSGNNNTGSIKQNIQTLQPGESYATPWGNITINRDGHPEMNGVLMTSDNSSLVSNPWTGGITRVLNSLIDKPTVSPPLEKK